MGGTAGSAFLMKQRVNQLVEKSQQSGFFADRSLSIGARIDWGTVNECWVLNCEEAQYLARLGRDLPKEFLNTWKSELRANQIAANAGLAPMPLFVDEDSLAAIYPWCGEPLSRIELTKPLLREIADRLSLLHYIEAPVPQVSYRLTIENYLGIIDEDSDWIRDNNIELAALLEQADAWDQSDEVRFCHHDLNPGNILWDGKHCSFIDWEYARVAHPLFDLASLSKHFQLSDKHLELLLTHYPRHDYWIEQVRSAETVVIALEKLWLEAARLSLFDKTN
jgi:hypothetical protein